MSDVPELSPTVLVHTKTTHQFPGVAVIRCHDLFDTHVTSKRNLPVTTPERTVVDLAAHIPIGRLGRVLDNALASGIASLERVDAVLHDVARRGKPGVATVRTLLAERSGEDHDGSILEARANKLLGDAGFERLEFEYPIPWYPQRRFDVAIPSHRLAIEWDSRAWHSQLGAFAADRKRDQDAIAHGWRVLRFTWSDVHDRPIHVVSTIALALE
jgi:very-short-patch-repair endonuclease